jgi:DNA invertase Pin-like site-specific DNA recombinase
VSWAAPVEALHLVSGAGQRFSTWNHSFGSQIVAYTNRDWPGLREALAACRDGDTLVITKLDRLARSLPDAREILDGLTRRHVKLSLGGSLHDPNDPVGRLLFNVLAMVAEFEADLIRLRTREGMRVAKAKGHLRGKQPKLNRTALVAAAATRSAPSRSVTSR